MKADFKIKIFEQKMLKDLYQSVKGLYAYTFYSRYAIEPNEMFSFIIENTNKGILKYEDDILTLTDEGRDFVLKELLINKESSGVFSKIPEEYICNRIEINSPYLPNVKNVSDEILNIKKVE